ncbi:MAG: DinB family protein, partial [Bacteroidota bacterium]
MKKINLTLALLFMTFMAWSQASFLSEFEQKWANAKAYTLELAESMPESAFDFSPTEEQMTFKEQLLHITSNMVWLTSSYLDGEKLEADLKKEGYTKAEVIQILTDGFDNAAEAVKNFPVEDLETEVKFFAGPMSKRQIMVLMNDHVTHHRGQIIVYARLKGIKPPR